VLTVRSRKKPVAKTFDAKKEIRAIARERVGTVKPAQAIIPKSERKPKHKKSPEADQ
jgi:hypothetical protein